jgi:hypothetical protein
MKKIILASILILMAAATAWADMDCMDACTDMKDRVIADCETGAEDGCKMKADNEYTTCKFNCDAADQMAALQQNHG